MNSSTQEQVLQIRKCGMNDLERVTALLREFGYPTTLSVMKERMEGMEHDPLHCTMVAELNNEVVGMIGLRQVKSYYKHADCIRSGRMGTPSRLLPAVPAKRQPRRTCTGACFLPPYRIRKDSRLPL
jgi:hypothetical protein